MKQSNLLRYLFALFGFLCCIGLCGCVESVELSERALVQAIGIDVEDGEYTVTIQDSQGNEIPVAEYVEGGPNAKDFGDIRFTMPNDDVTITVTTNKAAIENTKTNTITATGTYNTNQTVTGTRDTAAGDGSTPAQETYEITLTMPSADLTKIEVTMVDKA